MVTIMTALWFEHLQPEDRVSVKPHASPVLHAINYLLGELDAAYLATLREFGGLQSYPSRSKDPDPVDYSTGSVGIGATAPIWGALARRYVDDHARRCRARGRQYSLVGDAELDEGASGRRSSTRWSPSSARSSGSSTSTGSRWTGSCPNIGAARLQGMFAAAGWQVLTVKYGRLLEELFARPGRRRAADPDRRHVQPRVPAAAALRSGAAARAAARRRRRDAPACLSEPGRRLRCRGVRNLGGHDLGCAA